MRARLILAVAIAVAGSAVAVRAIQRTRPFGTTDAASGGGQTHARDHAAGDFHHPSDLPNWRDLHFKNLKAHEALTAIRASLNEDQRWSGVDLSADERRWLQERVSARMSYVLEGTPEAHVREAIADGANRTSPPPGLSEGSLSRLNSWPDIWRDAPVDAAGLRVRMLDFSSEAAFDRSLTPASTRSSLQCDYGPDRIGAQTYEVVIPIRPLIEVGSNTRMPAFLGVAYDRVAPGGPWRPRGIRVYTASHPGGRPLVAPPM